MQNVFLVLLITDTRKWMLSPLCLLLVLFQKTKLASRHVFSTLSLLASKYTPVLHIKTDERHYLFRSHFIKYYLILILTNSVRNLIKAVIFLIPARKMLVYSGVRSINCHEITVIFFGPQSKERRTLHYKL